MIISFDITRAFCILDNITIFLKRNEASFINATVYDVVAQVTALHLKTGEKINMIFLDRIVQGLNSRHQTSTRNT